MMFKNIYYAFLALSMVNVVYASKVENNPYVIGHITKEQVKNFAASFAIGATHGLVNNGLMYVHSKGSPNQDLINGQSFCIEVAACAGALALERAYHGENAGNYESLWGHGLGQFLTESFLKVTPEAYGSYKVTPGLTLNLNLFLAIMNSLGL